MIKQITKNIFLTLALSLFSASVWAQSQTTEKVPEIQVSSLGQYRGQYLNLLFVEANNPPVAFDPSRIDVRVIKVKPQQVRIEGNEVKFSASDIPKRPLKFAYNFLLLVVSPNPDFSWVNNDGSRPLPLEWHTPNNLRNFFKVIPRASISYGDGSALRISIAE